MLMNMFLVYYFYFKFIIFYLQKIFTSKEKLMVNELISFFTIKIKYRKYLKISHQ